MDGGPELGLGVRWHPAAGHIAINDANNACDDDAREIRSGPDGTDGRLRKTERPTSLRGER